MCDAIHDHVCIMEGPDPELSVSITFLDELRVDKRRADNEIQRLRTLLQENDIDYTKKSVPSSEDPKLDQATKEASEESQPPNLPHEILLNILGYAVTSSATLTDPFYKGRKGNMTSEEKIAREQINVNFLATSKAFRDEGTALILKNNTIVFTQAAAIANFAKIPQPLRLKFEKVTFRVVGRYYSDKAQKNFRLDTDPTYANALPPGNKISLLARPQGMINDGGIHAYCYQQVGDFLKALVLPLDSVTGKQGMLLPSLKAMRIDLVNFCGNLSLGHMGFFAILRWYLGRKLDELHITGIQEAAMDYVMHDPIIDAYVLQLLLKNGGLFSESSAKFISVQDGLKRVPGNDIYHQLVHPDRIPFSASTWKKAHPEGGLPPQRSSLLRKTVFKWAFERLNDTEKQWIEFDYDTGEQLEPDWDMYERDSDSDTEDEYDFEDYGEVEEDFEENSEERSEEDLEENSEEGRRLEEHLTQAVPSDNSSGSLEGLPKLVESTSSN